MIKIIIATLLLFAVVVYGGMTIYYKYTYPDMFVCRNAQEQWHTHFNDYTECIEGFDAYNVPVLGTLWKYDAILGLILIMLGGFLWWIKLYPYIGQK